MLSGLFHIFRPRPTTLGKIVPERNTQPVYDINDPRHWINRGWTCQSESRDNRREGRTGWILRRKWFVK
jgi:hypothetical protein